MTNSSQHEKFATASQVLEVLYRKVRSIMAII